jgi:hypothetical protein
MRNLAWKSTYICGDLNRASRIASIAAGTQELATDTVQYHACCTSTGTSLPLHQMAALDESIQDSRAIQTISFTPNPKFEDDMNSCRLEITVLDLKCTYVICEIHAIHMAVKGKQK